MSRRFEKFRRQVAAIPARLRRGNGEVSGRRGQINGDVTGLSRICRGRLGEVGIVEFEL